MKNASVTNLIGGLENKDLYVNAGYEKEMIDAFLDEYEENYDMWEYISETARLYVSEVDNLFKMFGENSKFRNKWAFETAARGVLDDAIPYELGSVMTTIQIEYNMWVLNQISKMTNLSREGTYDV